jgi:hypothetical protein
LYDNWLARSFHALTLNCWPNDPPRNLCGKLIFHYVRTVLKLYGPRRVSLAQAPSESLLDFNPLPAHFVIFTTCQTRSFASAHLHDVMLKRRIGPRVAVLCCAGRRIVRRRTSMNERTSIRLFARSLLVLFSTHDEWKSREVAAAEAAGLDRECAGNNAIKATEAKRRSAHVGRTWASALCYRPLYVARTRVCVRQWAKTGRIMASDLRPLSVGRTRTIVRNELHAHLIARIQFTPLESCSASLYAASRTSSVGITTRLLRVIILSNADPTPWLCAKNSLLLFDIVAVCVITVVSASFP